MKKEKKMDYMYVAICILDKSCPKNLLLCELIYNIHLEKELNHGVMYIQIFSQTNFGNLETIYWNMLNNIHSTYIRQIAWLFGRVQGVWTQWGSVDFYI